MLPAATVIAVYHAFGAPRALALTVGLILFGSAWMGNSVDKARAKTEHAKRHYEGKAAFLAACRANYPLSPKANLSAESPILAAGNPPEDVLTPMAGRDTSGDALPRAPAEVRC